MTAMLSLPPIADYVTAGVLTLVIPLGILICVAIWYVVLWYRHAGDV